MGLQNWALLTTTIGCTIRITLFGQIQVRLPALERSTGGNWAGRDEDGGWGGH